MDGSTKTLANTIQHPQPKRRGWNGSTKSTVRTHPAHPTGHAVHARVHSPVLKPPHHTTPGTHPTQGHGQDGGNGTPPPTRGLAVREPNSMHHTTTTHTTTGAGALTLFPASKGRHPATRPGKGSIPSSAHHRAPTKLRRKEVIQPHLPVRLPCYDLVPITSLTLDGSPHKG